MTPSVTRKEVSDLARQGVRPGDIAKRLGIQPHTVYYHIKAARKSGVKIPHFSTRTGDAAKARANKLAEVEGYIAVPLRLKPLLERQAERKGVSPQDLARTILERGLLDGASRHG